MKRRPVLVASTLAVLAIFGDGSSAARAADGPVRVLSTTTDLAEIARSVGGTLVTVESLCRGPEDPHFLDARPSFIQLANRAELLIVNGMDLEVGYLPLLLRDGSNPKIRPGSSGYLDASVRIKKLEVPSGGISRAQGDVHPGGNPHYLLDPANAGVVAEDVAEALAALRPASAQAFRDGAKALRLALTDLLLGPIPGGDPKGRRSGGLVERFKAHKGASLVAYHENMIYLARRFGLEVLGTLEPKPGISPTAAHLATLSERARAAKVKAVVYNVFQSGGQASAFAQGIGATAVLIAHQPGAVGDAPDLLSTYRRNAEALLAALSGSGAAR